MRQKCIAKLTFKPAELAKWVLALTIGLGCPLPLLAQLGHSHNDYLRPRPLWDALDAGLLSIEVDVYARAGRLRVAHWPWQIRRGRTFRSLYLQPLADTLARAHPGGANLPSPAHPLRLLVDCKNRPAQAHQAVLAELRAYPQLFLPGPHWAPEPTRQSPLAAGAPVYVVFTGQCRGLGAAGGPWLIPLEAADTLALAQNQAPPTYLSLKWGRYFRWNGKGDMPEAERSLLRSLAAIAPPGGLRLYAAPDTPRAWHELKAAGVQWINTDVPARYAQWKAQQP
jgi:hypothetical protein